MNQNCARNDDADQSLIASYNANTYHFDFESLKDVKQFRSSFADYEIVNYYEEAHKKHENVPPMLITLLLPITTVIVHYILQSFMAEL